MAFIRTVPVAEADDAVAAMYRRQQAAWGYVPNYAKVFSHRPQVMARWGQLLAEIKRPMDRRRFELVTFVAAHELRNSPCALAHGQALRPFFDDDEIVAIAADRIDELLSPAECAMLRFARRIARDAASVTREDVDALEQAGLDAGEVFDIAAVAAGRAFFTKLLDALGVLPDAACLRIDARLREPLTVGRAIDRRACEAMPESVDSAAQAASGR